MAVVLRGCGDCDGRGDQGRRNRGKQEVAEGGGEIGGADEEKREETFIKF